MLNVKLGIGILDIAHFDIYVA